MFVKRRIHKPDEKSCLKSTDIPWPARAKNAEEAVTDIHIPSISSDHRTANTWQIYANI
jgi:hypothetical protein